MQQKTIWMRYLTLGLLISIMISVSNSCAKINYAQDGEFYFINTTPYLIKYKVGYEKFNVPPNGTLFIRDSQDGGKSISPTTFHAPFKGIGSSTIIQFGEFKCLEITPSSEFGPLNIRNYISEKLNAHTYKFTYTFTEADYNRAVTCP